MPSIWGPIDAVVSGRFEVLQAPHFSEGRPSHSPIRHQHYPLPDNRRPLIQQHRPSTLVRSLINAELRDRVGDRIRLRAESSDQ